ncbi:hypothetical protein MMF96_17560 [Arthrobacter sp. STN4]|nr:MULTISPECIES: hypothetical protein [unclassified Arthrobacter]MCQ9165853.1 hypothetical protein [Arthrobacter sp. STN4]
MNVIASGSAGGEVGRLALAGADRDTWMGGAEFGEDVEIAGDASSDDGTAGEAGGIAGGPFDAPDFGHGQSAVRRVPAPALRLAETADWSTCSASAAEVKDPRR